MGKVRYLGSKARLVRAIWRHIGALGHGERTFVDAFTGTGVVSREAALRGWRVRANDHLQSSALLTIAHLLSPSQVPFDALGGYRNALALLQNSEAYQGFVWREYTPSKQSQSGHERRYFSLFNGGKIDGMRRQIARWSAAERLTALEESLLLADLMGAANAVANIAGTYGCFLKDWSEAALKPLTLSARELLPRAVDFRVTTRDAFAVTCAPEDVVYLDPPYTKRQYAAYYHLLETIAEGDEPHVEGVTGLRPWEAKASPFCYKTRALSALTRWVNECPAHHVFISYSSEGHIALDELEAALLQRAGGEVWVHPLAEIERYRPNRGAHLGASHVTEYLIEVARDGARRCAPRVAQNPLVVRRDERPGRQTLVWVCSSGLTFSMADIRSHEATLLTSAEALLQGQTAPFPGDLQDEARLQILEAAAALCGGFAVSWYFDASPFTTRESQTLAAQFDPLACARELIARLGELPFSVSLALSSLARAPLDADEQRRQGSFNTDFRLAQFLAAPLKEERLHVAAPRIVDWACGTGVLLVAAAQSWSGVSDKSSTSADRIALAHFLEHGAFGVDLSRRALRGAALALASLTDSRCAIEGLWQHLRAGDSLLESQTLWENVVPQGFDAVVGNPPWEKLKLSRHEWLRAQGVERHYRAARAALCRQSGSGHQIAPCR